MRIVTDEIGYQGEAEDVSHPLAVPAAHKIAAKAV
jgi:hypothetical protein